MPRNRKSLLLLMIIFLSIAVLALPRRSTADSNFLPLVANGQGTPSIDGTITPTPSATATLPQSTKPSTATTTATSSPTGTSTTTSTGTSTRTPTPTATLVPGGSVITVTVGSNFFSPSVVPIQPGDTVVWQRVSGSHNMAADDNSFRLGQGPNGDVGIGWTTVSRTFTETGTFGYYCQLHGGPGGVDMAGTITVGN
jgi:plastocyanin